MRFYSKTISWLLVALAICLGVGTSLQLRGAGEEKSGASISETKLKAVYLLNFARFMEWPEGTWTDDSQPFVIGLLGIAPLANDLREVVRDKKIGKRVIKVMPVGSREDIDRCQLLYVSKGGTDAFREILKTIADKPILSVGEDPHFAATNGLIGFVVEEEKLRFELNLAAAEKAKLKASARLIGLAKLVSPKNP